MVSTSVFENHDWQTNTAIPSRPLFRVKIMLLGWLTFSNALAETPSQEQLLEDYYFDELPLVLSVTRLKQSLADTPASVTVIDRDMIRASAATNIPDLLRLVPGFQVAFISGKRASVTAHGRSDQYARDMQVTIDGRSIYDPVFGGVSWNDIGLDIDDIQRIEVVRGPNAASHGSNSFAGVINIFTEHPAQQQGVELKTLLGDGQNRYHYGRYAGSIGKLNFRVTGSYTEDDGFDSRIDDSTTRSFSYRGDYMADNDNSLLFELGYTSGPREEGFPGSLDQPARDAYHVNHYQQLRWRRQLSADDELSLQLYHNYQKKDDDFVVDLPPEVHAGYGFKSHRYDGELEYTKRFSDQLRFAAGFGGRYETGEGFWTLGDDTVSRRQFRLFTNAEWKFEPDTVVNLGAMYEAFEGKRGLLSPRLAINHHLNPNSTIRFALSRAYRMPTLWEDNSKLIVYLEDDLTPLDYFFLTEDDLDPEEITLYEVGYLGKFPKHGVMLDVRLYKERISDIITNIDNENIDGPSLFSIPGAQSYVNDGSLKIYGLELELSYKPTPRTLLHFGYNVSNAKGEQLRRIYADQSTRQLDLQESVPEQTFSLLAGYRFENGIEVSSAYYYVDPMEWLYDGDHIPVQTRWDFRVGKRFRSPGSDIDLEFIFQNIDGDDYDFYNAPDRDPPQVNISEYRYFLQARMNFH